MRCFVYAFYNKKVGAYEKPIVNNFEVDTFKQLVIRDVLVSDNDAKTKMQETELYHLGCYDDETAKFELLEKPDYLLNLGDLIVGKKEGDNNA